MGNYTITLLLGYLLCCFRDFLERKHNDKRKGLNIAGWEKGRVIIMIKVMILLIIIGIIFYLLYINGLFAIQLKGAILYVGSLSGNKAKFVSCTGYTKRIIRFEEDKTYRMVLNTELSVGGLSITILDSEKNSLFSLDKDIQNGFIYAEKGKRYYLIVRFQSATGNYTLKWD